MAIEIPVTVDIDRTFREAAKRVPQAIAPMQKAVDENTLEVIVEINKKGDLAEVFDFVGKSKRSMSELQYAIKSVKQQLDDLYQKTGGNVDLTQGEGKALSEALVVLKDIVAQRQGLSKQIEKNAQDVQREIEAEREHRAAINMVANSIDDLNIKLAAWRQELNSADARSSSFVTAAKNAGLLERALEKVNAQARIIGMNTGSIDQLNARLQDINRRFNELPKSARFGEVGEGLLSEYRALSKELEKEGRSLQQIIADETRLAQLRQKGIQSRRYENAILNTTAKTMRVLQEQERILSDRLARTTIGSSAYNKLKADLEGVRRELSDINGETMQTESRLGRLVKNSLRLVALHAAGTFIRNVREVTAEFELQRVALGSIIQDTERAEGLFRQIKAAAIESPFEIKDLVSYTKQLSAYQIETDKLFDTTMKLADVSAGLGVDMSRLVLAYGQVRAAAVLRGQELRQFTEAGIPLVDKLAEKFRELGREGTTTADVFQLISERAVPFRMIEEIFDDMTSAGGMFYKMQEKQAKTLAGQWANLKDAVSIMYDEIGNTDVVHNAMESMIGGARSVMQNWRSWYNVIKIVSSGLLSYVGIAKLVAVYTDAQAAASRRATAAESEREKNLKKLITGLIGKTAAEKVSTLATKLHTAAMNKAAAASNGLSAALWRVAAAMANNPFGIAVIAVGSLIALMTTLRNKTHDVSENIDNAEASIARFNKTTGDTAKLIDQYEELSKKEKLTAQEAAKLRDISRDLGNIFPKTTEGINQQTGALTLNIEKLKQYNLEAEKAIRKGMQAQISENKTLIEDNQKEIDRLTKENTRGWGRNKKLGLLSPILFPLTNAQVAENAKKLVKLQDDNEKLAKTNQELQDSLDGVKKSTADAAEETAKWQEKLIEFNERKTEKGEALQIVSPDQIKNYSKLSDALEDIAKKYKEYAEQEKSMKNAIQGKTGAERQELQGILDRTTARKNLAKEELDYYNAFYLTEKKSGQSDRLRKLRSEINELTNAYKKYLELRKYKTQADALADINTLFPQLAGWAPTYQNVLSKLGTLQTKYKGDTEATRLINQALSNIKFDALKTELQKKIAQISDDLKRSETIRNFYKDIFDATGDQQIATNLTMSVYGDLGQDFRDRIQKSMIDSINSIPADKLSEAARLGFLGDITVFDVDNIKRNLDLLPPEVKKLFEELLQQNEAYNAQWEKDFIKRYQKAKTYAERIATLEDQRTAAEKEARERGKSPAEIAAVTAYWNKQIAGVQLEAMKDTYTWTKAFEDLDGVSTRTLNNLIDLINEYVDKNRKNLEPQQLKELIRARENAEAQKIQRNAFAGTADAIAKLTSRRAALRLLERKGLKDAETLAVVEDNTQDAIKQLSDSLGQLNAEMDSLINSTKGLFSAFASDREASYFSSQMDNISSTMAAVTKSSTGIAALMSGIITPDTIISTLSGLTDLVASIANIWNTSIVERANRTIEEQERLIDDLAYAYSRLEEAEKRALGSEYIANYQSRIDNLEAQAAAYDAQADAERSKGKKADQDRIRDFENSARDARDSIKDMSSEISEKYLGTDLTSAARDFANAWIEAYKSFGSTTDALKEKFADMIQSMVTESLAARVVQEQLAPIFEMIDTLSADDGQFSVMDAAAVANKTKETVGALNVGLTNLMNALSGAGINVRSMGTGLTGIAKDIQGASEESILGLAAGVNTQNFFMSQINANVIRIVEMLGGSATQQPTPTPGSASGMSAYQTEALSYLGHLPQMQSDMAEVRRLLSEVIKVKGASSTYSVRIS